jgi:hypothetical protein
MCVSIEKKDIFEGSSNSSNTNTALNFDFRSRSQRLYERLAEHFSLACDVRSFDNEVSYLERFQRHKKKVNF